MPWSDKKRPEAQHRPVPSRFPSRFCTAAFTIKRRLPVKRLIVLFTRVLLSFWNFDVKGNRLTGTTGNTSLCLQRFFVTLAIMQSLLLKRQEFSSISLFPLSCLSPEALKLTKILSLLCSSSVFFSCYSGNRAEFISKTSGVFLSISVMSISCLSPEALKSIVRFQSIVFLLCPSLSPFICGREYRVF